MARLVDVIEQMIKAMIDENDGQAVISRSQLAEQANCVPSQITYVLSTRFSSGNGYIVESRRGGGGQITITRVSHTGPEHYLQAILDAVCSKTANFKPCILVETSVIIPNLAMVILLSSTISI